MGKSWQPKHFFINRARERKKTATLQAEVQAKLEIIAKLVFEAWAEAWMDISEWADGVDGSDEEIKKHWEMSESKKQLDALLQKKELNPPPPPATIKKKSIQKSTKKAKVKKVPKAKTSKKSFEKATHKSLEQLKVAEQQWQSSDTKKDLDDFLNSLPVTEKKNVNTNP